MSRVLLVGLWLWTGWAFAAPAPSAEKSYAAGRAAFGDGDFDGALRHLDRAAKNATDEALLARIHLARGECYAALQDYAKVESAFAEALAHDPEAKLDPAQVLPAVVSLLDGLRDRLRGELSVSAEPAGSALTFDGRPLGVAPFTGKVPIGRHRIEARRADGKLLANGEVVVHPRTPQSLRLQPIPEPPPAPPPPVAVAPAREGAGTRLLVDARLNFDPQGGLSVEGGAGAGARNWLAFASFTAGALPGVTLRGGVRLPELLGPVGAYATLDGVLFIGQPLFPGIGGALGVSWQVTDWLEPYAEASGRLMAPSERFQSRYVLLAAGLRLRLF